MLNALPDTRNAHEITDVFLSPNEYVSVDNQDAAAADEQEKIGLTEQRSSPVESSDSDPPFTVEVPDEKPKVETGVQAALPMNNVDRSPCEGVRLDMVKDPNVWVRLLAECVAELFGTLILVLFGCSGIAQYTLSRATLSGFLSVNFAFGFGAMIAVYVAGPISGAHLNPAVSIAMMSLRSITPLQCLIYIIAQFIGAFIAAALVFGTYYDAINRFDSGKRQVSGNQSTAGIFGTLPAQGVSQVTLFFDQVLSTCLLLVAICSLSNKRNKLVANAQIPLAVGFIVVAIGVAFGYNCGFPINPARDLGPRIFTYFVGYGREVFTVGNYYFWIPCIGPVFGALIGAWIYYGYSKLMKLHIGEHEKEIVRARYQVDMQSIVRI